MQRTLLWTMNTMVWYFIWTLIYQSPKVEHTPITVKFKHQYSYYGKVMPIQYLFIFLLYISLGTCCSHGSWVAFLECGSANQVYHPSHTMSCNPVVRSSCQQIYFFEYQSDYD